MITKSGQEPVLCRDPGFGDAAAGGVQGGAEGAHLARGFGGGRHEGAALVLGEVEAAPFGVEELHAGLRLVTTVHPDSVSRRGRRRHAAAGISAPRPSPARHCRWVPDTELSIVYQKLRMAGSSPSHDVRETWAERFLGCAETH